MDDLSGALFRVSTRTLLSLDSTWDVLLPWLALVSLLATATLVVLFIQDENDG